MSRIISYRLFSSFMILKKIEKNYFSNESGLILNKKKYLYYDYFFFLINYDLYNYTLNFIIFKNFKNFLNFFYCLNLSNKKFVVFDYDYKFSLFFKNLLFSDFILTKYNNFFKFNFKKLKNQTFFFFFKQFIDLNSIQLIILLDYELFYLYSSLFNLLDISSFAFIKANYSSCYLDFFLIKSSSIYVLQKMIFFSTLYSIYLLSLNYRSLFLYKNFLFNLNKQITNLA